MSVFKLTKKLCIQIYKASRKTKFWGFRDAKQDFHNTFFATHKICFMLII